MHWMAARRPETRMSHPVWAVRSITEEGWRRGSPRKAHSVEPGDSPRCSPEEKERSEQMVEEPSLWSGVPNHALIVRRCLLVCHHQKSHNHLRPLADIPDIAPAANGS
jgi:hypothetical protein